MNDILVTNFIANDSDNNTIVGSLGCDREVAESILKGTYSKFKILNESDKETLDFEYISAYDVAKKSLKLNIDKAKEIKKEKLRIERFNILNKLDVQFMLAIENDDNETKTKIVEEKKRLRDITSLVDNASTIEEIKAVKI